MRKETRGIDWAIDTTTNVESVEYSTNVESVLAIPPECSTLHVQRGGVSIQRDGRSSSNRLDVSLIASLSAKQHHFAFAIASSFTVCWSPP